MNTNNSPLIVIIGNTTNAILLSSRLQYLGFKVITIGRSSSCPLSRLEAWGSSFDFIVHSLRINELINAQCVFIVVPTKDIIGASNRFLSYMSKSSTIPIIVICPYSLKDRLIQLSQSYPNFSWRTAICSVLLQHKIYGVYSLPVQDTGFLHWGALLKANNISLTPLEISLLKADSENIHPLFKCKNSWPHSWRVQWIIDTVIYTYSCANHCLAIEDLISQLKDLHILCDEATQIAHNLWGDDGLSKDYIYKQLVNFLAARIKSIIPANFVKMFIQEEYQYYSGLAKDPRKFPYLVSLTDKIKDKKLAL